MFMDYEAKNFENLLGIEGLSDGILNNHFALYGGYVANTNKLIEEIGKYQAEGTTAAPQYAELKRRFGWEWNGMRLHEYYFGSLSKEMLEFSADSILGIQIKKDFGSFEEWKKDFLAMGAMRGIGWVILCFDLATQKLFNIWINEHDGGHLAGAFPILVMDVFEHAYMLDYGTKKADYISAFMKAVDWKVVGDRYDWATKIQDVRPKGIDHIGCRC
jgi:Fe-Mn family superoxide dismutase